MWSAGEGAAMKKEGEMRTDHDGEPLTDAPVPGVGAIEIGHTVEDVELQEVELHHGPLENRGTVTRARLQADVAARVL